MGQIARETFNGIKWMLLQKCTLQPLQLVFGMILARLVTPEEIGILGLTAIFFAVASQLSECGFGAAIIRKQDRTEEDINTMFWFNAGMSLLMAVILFLSAPLFVNFFNQPALLWLTRASACMMFFDSLASIHWILYSARRDFKTPAIIQTIVALCSMPLCIGLAYADWGSWAIMTQGIFSGLSSLFIVWVVSPWKPRFIFSFKSFKEMYGYGSKLAFSGLLNTMFVNVQSLLIGRFYKPSDLAYYSRGQHLAELFPLSICSMLTRVTFPILATLQNAPERLRKVYQDYLRLFTLSVTWMCLCIAAYSELIIDVMYGEQWGQAVIFCKLLCFTYAIYHLQIINLNLLSVLGRSDLLLRLEIIKKVLTLSVMILCLTISVVAMCIGGVICSYISLFINSYFSKSLINMSIWKQLMDYTPLFLLAFITTWIPAYFITMLPIWSIGKLAFGCLVSFLFYFSILYILKIEALNDTLKLIQPHIPTRILKSWVSIFIRN